VSPFLETCQREETSFADFSIYLPVISCRPPSPPLPFISFFLALVHARNYYFLVLRRFFQMSFPLRRAPSLPAHFPFLDVIPIANDLDSGPKLPCLSQYEVKFLQALIPGSDPVVKLAARGLESRPRFFSRIRGRIKSSVFLSSSRGLWAVGVVFFL